MPAHTHRRTKPRTLLTAGAAVAAAAVGAAAVATASASPDATAPAPKAAASPTAAAASAEHFSPYVDTSLSPAFDLTAAEKASGTKDFTLAFLTSGGSCEPKWGGGTALGDDAVAKQISALRSAGGDVRVSFGGANGTELALACNSASSLAAAYGKAIDQYKLTRIDLDIEGGALGNTAANTRRAEAIAQLQKSHPKLDVSLTLPVLPTGLTQQGVDLVKDAKAKGVKVGAVNIMAMDYGDGAAPDPQGKMGDYAIRAATATQKQVKSALGLSDAAAWGAVAVTPMIGVNDTASEVFTPADAKKLADFAKQKKLARLSMWSGTRDKACPGGATNSAQPTCSSIDQNAWDFSKALNAYTG